MCYDDNIHKYRKLTGCITEPITLDINDPIGFEVNIDRSLSTHITATGPSFDSSSLYNKTLTRATFTYRMTGAEIEKFIDNNRTVNIDYKLSDGTTLSMSDVKFEPASSTGTSDNIRILPAPTDTPMIYESEKLYHYTGDREWLPVGEIKNNPWKEKEDDTDIFSISEQMKKVD